MRSLHARQLVFGLMIAAVAVCAVAYAGSSAPWANSAFAAPAGPSTPAKPLVTQDALSTPTSLKLGFGPDLSSGDVTPTTYLVTFDGSAQPTQTATGGFQYVIFSPLVPGSSHECTVVAMAFGRESVPATLTVLMSKAPVILGKPSVPSTGKTKKSIKVTGRVVSDFAVGTASVVKLKFYRHQKTRSGKWYWSWKKTLTAKRRSATPASYYLYTKLKPAGTWSVIAQTSATGSHVGATSPRSRSVKIK